MQTEHLPVMAAEVVELLVTRTDGVYVDCTVGAGGHARMILNNAPEGTLLGIDLDGDALEIAAGALSDFGERSRLAQGSFADLAIIARENGRERADGVLFDLGLSSMQLDDPGRGFSYRNDGPIDMRMDQTGSWTAGQLLERTSERELARILKEYGEERRAHPIARSIMEARDRGRLRGTADLAAAVIATKPGHRSKTLSRVFQALRIAVNRELENLADGLAQAVDLLTGGGRVAVISYHSLEDRMVKRYFATCERPCVCARDIPQCVCGRVPTLRVITRHVVVPGDAEVARNPRARSAKLRVAEKLAGGGQG
ncbi:MAG: 16S rRNA (cytosine(1402)-N(4))-methyltransferase RsmH [Candidatus Eisenbacteria bacterium]|nr:16S rRNA (cytosine(1402)-N(4))-methyltransferase RsmH [Candidatus Eisenbacteria bacterium]